MIKYLKESFIYVCETGQFDERISQQFGYDTDTNFLIGNVEGTHFGSKYYRTAKIVEDLDNEKVYINTRGFCLKLSKVYNGTVSISTRKQSTLYLVDPYHADSIRLLGRENLMLEIGDQVNGLFQGSHYDLKINLHDFLLWMVQPVKITIS